MALPNPIPGSPHTTPGEYNNPASISNTGATNIVGYPPGAIADPNSNPTSTSNVTGFLPDILMICQEAAEHASFDATSGYFLRTAKRSLDYLAMSWANYGLNLWTLDFIETPLVPGVIVYQMPQDTMDLIAPAIRTVYGNAQQDILITREDFITYLSQPNKNYTGKPNTIFVQRSAPAPQFYVWPVPDANIPYTLIWWRLRRMQNTGYATNGTDVPFRFIPALTYGLAWQLALKKKVKDYNLIALLKANYDESFQMARFEDRDRSAIYLQPFLSPY
jgi:hypothetical protein